MENKFNFLTPNILDITYEDFGNYIQSYSLTLVKI